MESTVPVQIKKEMTFDEAIVHFTKSEDIKGDSYIQTLYQHFCSTSRLILYGNDFNLTYLAKLIALSRIQLKSNEKIILKKLTELIVNDNETSWEDKVEEDEIWDNAIKELSKRAPKQEELTMAQMASLIEAKDFKEIIPLPQNKNSIYDTIEVDKLDNEIKQVIERVLKEGVPYKSKFCENKENCKFGKRCRFAHSLEEIKMFKLFNRAETRRSLGHPYRGKP